MDGGVVIVPADFPDLPGVKAVAALADADVRTSSLLESGFVMFVSPEMREYMEGMLGGDFL